MWKNYQIEVKNVEKKLGKQPETQLLQHGTKKTQPFAIYNGDFGFDKKFATSGQWGEATYFA